MGNQNSSLQGNPLTFYVIFRKCFFLLLNNHSLMGKADLRCQNINVNEMTEKPKEHEDSGLLLHQENYLR